LFEALQIEVSNSSHTEICREGICGSCAMNMDGTNGLACLTKVTRDGQATTVSPLPHMFVVRDLVVDMSNFYAQYKSIKPYLQTDSAHQCESLYTQSLSGHGSQMILSGMLIRLCG
jgi:succinate dehydrogenase/fumarate reductase iron-sulfur protein